MGKVQKKIDKICQKIKESILSDTNPNGLLRQKKEEYLKYLKLGHLQLEKLFGLDAAQWT